MHYKFFNGPRKADEIGPLQFTLRRLLISFKISCKISCLKIDGKAFTPTRCCRFDRIVSRHISLSDGTSVISLLACKALHDAWLAFAPPGAAVGTWVKARVDEEEEEREEVVRNKKMR